MKPSSLHLISVAAVLFALAGEAHAQGSSPADGSLPAEFLKEMDNGGAAIPPPPSGPPSATGQAPSPSDPAQATPPAQPAAPPPAAQMPAAPQPPPQAAPQPRQQQMPGGYVDPNLGTVAGGTALSNEEYVYDPTGRRDPFKPYRAIRTDAPVQQRVATPGDTLEPLQRLELETLSIVGILWDVRQPRALVKDANGNLHTLVRNTKVGRNNGYVAAIREGEIVVIETVEEEGRSIKRTKVLELKRAEK